MLKNKIVFTAITVFALTLFGVWVLADVNLIVFKAGDPIKAEEVNANFQSLANETTVNAQDIQDLKNTLPIKFSVTFTKDNITCLSIPNTFPESRFCQYFIDHPALNAKPNVWVFARYDCDLYIDATRSGCVKSDFSNIESNYGAVDNLAYDKITQKWFIQEFRNTPTDTDPTQEGLNILVFP